jgi:hypothetical protein
MGGDMSNATYMGSADPDRSRAEYSDYYPAWLDNLAEDATIEGSLLGGAAQGPDAVRTIVGAIRRVLPRQRVLKRTYPDCRFARAATHGSPALVSRCPGVASVP